MRDRLIHAYFSVDWEIVWDVLTHEIPAQKLLIGGLLERCDEEESKRE
nr:HepT-like ribonuclease domain-containing protein [Methanofollis aquaemaris]